MHIFFCKIQVILTANTDTVCERLISANRKYFSGCSFWSSLLILQEDLKAAVTVIRDTPGSLTGRAAAAPRSSPSVCLRACWLRFLPEATCEPWSSEVTQRRDERQRKGQSCGGRKGEAAGVNLVRVRKESDASRIQWLRQNVQVCVFDPVSIWCHRLDKDRQYDNSHVPGDGFCHV